jgi:thioredoxin-related protein
MKLLVITIFSVFLVSPEWLTNFDVAKETAIKENKMILLNFSGSDWCSPCVRFKKNYIDNPSFKEFATTNLILFNADFPKLKKNAISKEQTAENEKLAEKYNPKGIFPLIILLNENGTVLKKWEKLPTETIDEFINQLK